VAASLVVYDEHVDQGQFENWIKNFTLAVAGDHLFWASAFRLLLHVAAYWLLDTIRRWATKSDGAKMHLDTPRLRLIKFDGRVLLHGGRIRLRLSSHHPDEALWRQLAADLSPGR
jgi:hypothetical protein